MRKAYTKADSLALSEQGVAVKKFLAIALFVVCTLFSSGAFAQSSFEEEATLTLACKRVEAIADVLKIQAVYGSEPARMLYEVYRTWGTCRPAIRVSPEEAEKDLEEGEYVVKRTEGEQRVKFYRSNVTKLYYAQFFVGLL